MSFCTPLGGTPRATTHWFHHIFTTESLVMISIFSVSKLLDTWNAKTFCQLSDSVLNCIVEDKNNVLHFILNNFQSAGMHSFGIKYVKKMLVYFNVFVIIWLLVTYVFLFGLSSVEKYIEKDVNIVNQEENPTTILPPGEIISFITYI